MKMFSHWNLRNAGLICILAIAFLILALGFPGLFSPLKATPNGVAQTSRLPSTLPTPHDTQTLNFQAYPATQASNSTPMMGEPLATQTATLRVYPTIPVSSPTPQPSQTIDTGQFQLYTDPAGQYTVLLGSGWKPGSESGTFIGPDGSYFHTAYLPEMGFMGSASRVCERLANTPQGPARIIYMADVVNLNACMLTPLPEMNTDRVQVVFMNPGGDPQHRFFYLESDAAQIESLAKSVQLLNPTSLSGKAAYPSGLMRPENEAFWGTARTPSADLTFEEYALVPDTQDSPRTNDQFIQNIPVDALQKRAKWRTFIPPLEQLERNNALLEPFGYTLRADNALGIDQYALYQGETLVMGRISEFRSVTVSASGKDFALLVDVVDKGSWLIQKGQLQKVDDASRWAMLGGPVFVGEDLFAAYWVPERQQIQVRKGSQVVFSMAVLFGANTGFQSFQAWNGHWLLEVQGFLFEDGKNLNDTLGYEEIFGWQLVNGKPFYYFRKGPRLGISYDGQVQAVYIDDMFHYGCCGFAANDNGGNQAMVWFYALRDGMWYYVEIGHYE
jgi:hypothetical protein